LLQRYLAQGDFVDCFSTQVSGRISLSQFITAFYSTRLFGLERIILASLLGKGSSEAQLQALAQDSADQFAAWSVEAREPHQMLLCDYRGRTRSWLMVAPGSGDAETRLYFGSAVIAMKHPATGERSMGGGFKALLGFHKLYSKALLNAARRQLCRNLQ
jgi:hypothetical protein